MRSDFGALPNGGSVDLFTLKSGDMLVQLTNYGARIVSVVKGGADLVYGPKSLSSFLTDTCYCGAICGRVANRIKDGQFYLRGKLYKVAVNNGPNHLHGGTVGYDQRLWTVKETTESRLVLELYSEDGEEGYPGNLQVVATYVLQEDTLELTIDAVCDTDTLVNLTNHVYWNLAAAGTIDGHVLQVNATAFTPKDSSGIPTGAILPVEKTVFDLNEPTTLGERNAPPYHEVADGFDHNYVVPVTAGMKTVAVLSYLGNGHEVKLSTDAPGLQVYTGEYLPAPRAGIALEPQGFPNAINVPHFPTVIVRPKTLARRKIAWSVR